jgi:hypothetical protein
VNGREPVLRHATRCKFCRAQVHAIGGLKKLGERAARHLRNCTSFAADFKRLQLTEGLELDRDTQISVLLKTAGLPIPAELPTPPEKVAAPNPPKLITTEH